MSLDQRSVCPSCIRKAGCRVSGTARLVGTPDTYEYYNLLDAEDTCWVCGQDNGKGIQMFCLEVDE